MPSQILSQLTNTQLGQKRGAAEGDRKFSDLRGSSPGVLAWPMTMKYAVGIVCSLLVISVDALAYPVRSSKHSSGT